MAEKMQITNRYDDIISLPHHQSKTRPHMPLIDRAAQFSPFAALTGYDDAVKETARQTERKADMSAGKAADFTGVDSDETGSDTDLF